MALFSAPRHRTLLALAKRKIVTSIPTPINLLAWGGSRYCPVCERKVRGFFAYDVHPEAWCPSCASMERHRYLWWFLHEKTAVFSNVGLNLLHIAPEKALASRLSRIAGLDYLTADLESPRADVKMDITNISYPDDSFDAVICSHVLEHVPEDATALEELLRVIRPGGWGAFMVPVDGEITREDPTVVTPEERQALYGQYDHVRSYGLDFRDRMARAGWSVETCVAGETLGSDECHRMGIPVEEVIFHGTKPAAG
jgi:SAM-dependent methyltransferase